ncbi:lipid droplet-associated protein [Mycobacterium avium subsp. paratuberculosis]|nr:hypothetical protein B0172_03046 [Mycobacterium avium subsp. paratuberculosis]OVF05625.1 hypothetical protein B0173_00336 [Mycobacterium avium subsp. paratuberculosis]CAG6849754.1 lipid droplet-associated protein [Mycobacterium avium subsp. paratuberculosis]CAG6850551.1 lipid droplet-associated protein [Mycobacterium avium subsp. paratuberculosis]CAG6851108.1 lipid droplet-associated protein [Mycobacterium avium subsp. paratuberculosis]
MRLPKTILMYPMTLASQAAHIVMRFQQNLAELVIKGDSTLESIFPPKDEKPEWATFDEDIDDAADGYANPADGSEGERRAEGRFALYSVADAHDDASALTRSARPSAKPAAEASVPTPAVVTELDYSALTLAQLRARLQSLSVDELEALLAYEQATKGRAPFQTLLANRITRATAK